MVFRIAKKYISIQMEMMTCYSKAYRLYHKSMHQIIHILSSLYDAQSSLKINMLLPEPKIFSERTVAI